MIDSWKAKLSNINITEGDFLGALLAGTILILTILNKFIFLISNVIIGVLLHTGLSKDIHL